MAIEPFLRELANEGVPLSRANLRALSKLTPGERDELHAAWPGIAATRRQAIVEQLRLISDSAVDVDFTPVFLRALHDDAPGVRAAAIQALWEYEGRDIIETLATLLATDGEIGVRAAAAEALGRFALLAEHGKLRPPDTSRVDEALRDAATGAATPLEVRARAIEAAGARSEPWVAAIIDDAYRGGNSRLRLGAIRAMGRNCDDIWVAPLIEDLADDDDEVRAEAATALGEIGDEQATPHLLALAGDADAELRLAAIGALGAIATLSIDGPAQRALEELTTAEDRGVAAAARSALEEALALDEVPEQEATL